MPGITAFSPAKAYFAASLPTLKAWSRSACDAKCLADL